MSREQSKTKGNKKRVVHNDAFKREAVRILSVGGRTAEEVAAI